MSNEKKVILPKSASDLQRLKLEKLMKKPDKEIVIAEKSHEYNPRAPLEFIRNVWGSSAGAGSGDFHVYRGVRRREYARQKVVLEKAKRDEADVKYSKKVVENVKASEDRTSKKRAKRSKKKQKQKGKKPKMDEKEKEVSDEGSDEETVVNGQVGSAAGTQHSITEGNTTNSNDAGAS